MYLTWRNGNITLFPVIHGRLEIGQKVAEYLEEIKPDCLAVELPIKLKPLLDRSLSLLPVITAIVAESQNSALYFLVEPHDPFVVALGYAARHHLPVIYMDMILPSYSQNPEGAPDTYSLFTLGHRRYFEEYFKVYREPLGDAMNRQRERMMAHALQQGKNFNHIAAFIGARHLPGLSAALPEPQPRPLFQGVPTTLHHYQLNHLHLGEVTSEIPWFIGAFHRDPLAPFDRLQWIKKLIEKTIPYYEERAPDPIKKWQSRNLLLFSHKYSRQEAMLLPDLFQIATAARGCVNDAFAADLWEMAEDLPEQKIATGLPFIDLRAADLFVGTRSLRLRPLSALPFKRPRRLFQMKQRKHEEQKGEWKKEFKGESMCSYQPEDLVIENFGDYLRKKARSLLDLANARVAPFETSLKDGLDVRETLRHWGHDKKIYVREAMPAQGHADSTVIIFDEDPGNGFTYHSTWQGEHDQESDMAFYSTPPGEKLVGPGISQCRYGGLVLTSPPRRMFDVWNDPFLLHGTKGKSEVLLKAALDYSQLKFVVYVAEKPPRQIFQAIATRYHKKIVFIPLGQIAPPLLEKLKLFHILEGHKKREIAPEYIR